MFHTDGISVEIYSTNKKTLTMSLREPLGRNVVLDTASPRAAGISVGGSGAERRPTTVKFNVNKQKFSNLNYFWL